MLVIYRKVPQMGETLLSWGGAWYLQVWRNNRLEVVTMLIYGKFRSLLEVGTLTPNPGEVSYMLLWKTIMLGEETLTSNPGQVRYILV